MHIRLLALQFLVILFIGGMGGVLFEKILLPKISEASILGSFSFFENIKNGVTVINKTEKIFIEENQALEKAVEGAEKSAVLIRIKNNRGFFLQDQSGFVLTNDGDILTLNTDLLKYPSYFFIRLDGGEEALEILKKDKDSGLVLLRSSSLNFQTAPLADFDSFKLGQRAFLIGVWEVKNNIEKFVNVGTVRSFNDNEINLNITEEKSASGSPLFNLKGELMGINQVERDGRIKAISINRIKEMLK